jgi:hypothetical protein
VPKGGPTQAPAPGGADGTRSIAAHTTDTTQTERQRARGATTTRSPAPSRGHRGAAVIRGLEAWLLTRATLHGYSLNNTYLIALEAQRRGFEPTSVAGFRAWRKLGRVVRKGELGLPIFAPITRRQRATEDQASDRDDLPRTHFRVVHVFDTLSRDRRDRCAPTG